MPDPLRYEMPVLELHDDEGKLVLALMRRPGGCLGFFNAEGTLLLDLEHSAAVDGFVLNTTGEARDKVAPKAVEHVEIAVRIGGGPEPLSVRTLHDRMPKNEGFHLAPNAGEHQGVQGSSTDDLRYCLTVGTSFAHLSPAETKSFALAMLRWYVSNFGADPEETP